MAGITGRTATGDRERQQDAMRDFTIGVRREKAGDLIEAWAEWRSLKVTLDPLASDFVEIRQSPDVDSRGARISVSVLNEIHQRLLAETLTDVGEAP